MHHQSSNTHPFERNKQKRMKCRWVSRYGEMAVNARRNACVTFTTTGCYISYRRGFRMHHRLVRDSIHVRNLAECELECSRTRPFVCHTFHFRYFVVGDQPILHNTVKRESCFWKKSSVISSSFAPLQTQGTRTWTAVTTEIPTTASWASCRPEIWTDIAIWWTILITRCLPGPNSLPVPMDC